MARPRLLDLFCCAGGAAAGYHRAGFDVLGVDIEPQPRYPFPFVRGDALEYLARHGRGFDAVHASPPCQMYTAYRRSRPGKGDEHYVNLIPATRAALEANGRPWVIENVGGAPLRAAALLCGSMFRPPLMVRRHRWFEAPFLLLSPGPCRHAVWTERLFPGGRSKERAGDSRAPARFTVEVGTWDIDTDVQKKAMGIDWMTLEELSQAIPPAYTEFVGRQLLAALEGA
jgi:DNA (cytosine-5)-methyltransferase 1